MNHNTTSSTAGDSQTGSSIQDRTRLFYVGAACVMLLVTLIGFQDFFLRGGKAYPGAREIAPSIRNLVIFHGASMMGWMVLFLGQSLLIATGRRRLHMAMGPAAVALAVCILVSGLWLNVESTRLADPERQLFGVTNKQFMALGFAILFVFVAMMGVGLWWRRRPEIHRPMMLLATLGPLTAAIGRIDAVIRLYEGTTLERVFADSLGMLVLGAIFFFVKWWMSRKLDKWYLIGYGALALASLASVQIARTAAWDRVASLLLR
jgi:hypothetical protein